MNPLPLAPRDRPRRRSRNGCLTCKRRKVRCNEQRPRCFHCQRLGLNCMWKEGAPHRPSSPPKDAVAGGTTPGSSLAAAALDVDWPAPAADFFDFAQAAADSVEDFSMFQDVYLSDLGGSSAAARSLHERVPTDPRLLDSPPTADSPRSLLPDADVEDSLLHHAPPIFDPVENGPICASLRALLDSMVASSTMVRHAMAAFAAVQFFNTGEKVDYRIYYDKAARELSEQFSRSSGGRVGSSELRYVLTTIFFLTYINVRQSSLCMVQCLQIAFADFGSS